MRRARACAVAVCTMLLLGACGASTDQSVTRGELDGATAVIAPLREGDRQYTAIAESMELAVVGGSRGCVGYRSGGSEVLVLFPHGTAVTHAGGRPTLRFGDVRFEIGDHVSVGPANIRTLPLGSLVDASTVPRACRGLRAQELYDVLGATP